MQETLVKKKKSDATLMQTQTHTRESKMQKTKHVCFFKNSIIHSGAKAHVMLGAMAPTSKTLKSLYNSILK